MGEWEREGGRERESERVSVSVCVCKHERSHLGIDNMEQTGKVPEHLN